MDNNQPTINGPTRPSQTDEIQQKLNQLPGQVLAWLYSPETSTNTINIARQFNLGEDKIPILAKITGHLILKTVPLNSLAPALEKILVVNNAVARQISVEIANRQLLPIRDYLAGVEDFVRSLGGQLPSPLPAILKPEAPKPVVPQTITAPAQEPDTIINQDIVTAISEREEVVLNQTISEKPLKLSDSEMLKLPSIRNWITDYKQYKSNFPSQERTLVRARYLHDTPNTKNLTEQERKILTQLLRSYDEYIVLPFSKKTGLLLLDKLVTPATGFPKQPSTSAPQPPYQASSVPPFQQSQQPSQPPGALPTSQPVPPPPSPPPPQKDTYREQVAPQDLAGPQSAQRPAPKLNGNVINLKDLGTGQQ